MVETFKITFGDGDELEEVVTSTSDAIELKAKLAADPRKDNFKHALVIREDRTETVQGKVHEDQRRELFKSYSDLIADLGKSRL